MKSINNLTGQEQLSTSIPFTPSEHDVMEFTQTLEHEYEDDQLTEINRLIQDVATETLIRFIQFITNAETDKQLIARVICLNKLFNNKHGNWSKLAAGHNVTIKSIRAERDRIKHETRVIHSISYEIHIQDKISITQYR